MGTKGSKEELPPYAEESEKALLGSVLLEPGIYDEVRSRLKPEAFYDLRHQEIWKALIWLRTRRKPMDVLSAVNRLKDAGKVDQVGGYAYLSSLQDTVPSVGNFGYYLEIVIEKWILRRIWRACTLAVSSIKDKKADFEAVKLISDLQQEITDACSLTTTRTARPLKDFVLMGMEEIERMDSKDAATVGLATGFERIDNLMGGLHNGEMTILAARPSVGKSAMATEIALNIATKCNIPVGFFTLEMSGRSVALRAISSRASVNLRTLVRGELINEERDNLRHSAGSLLSAKVFLDDSANLTGDQLVSKAKVMKGTHGIGMIVVDYLQLLRYPGNVEKRYLGIGENTKLLHGLACELDIPILVLSQLGRGVDGRKPQLSDLSESSAIEQDADNVIMLYRPEETDKTKVTAIIGKQRNGPTGYFNLKFFPEFTRFEDEPKIKDEDVPNKMKNPYKD